MEQPPDLARLARAARTGDAAAVDAFLTVVQPAVVRSVRLVVGSGSAIAEEACQDALLDIVRGLPRLESPERAVAWAMRIAMRRALRASRGQRLRARFGGSDRLEDARDPRLEPGRTLQIREAFDALPPRLRAVAVLRLYVGLSEEQTAEALGCAPGTVKSRLHAARSRLRRSLGPSELSDPSPLVPVRRPT